ncbi:phosphate ABC transporter permease PstA [Faunimonas sp. B44]|uniref:phosphate ABC transporter permease PstA n=1 Tax=Faunimonas sp. B44 TaxID=3461493 RepID=UPI004043D042
MNSSTTAGHRLSSDAAVRLRRKRYAADRRLRWFGIAAIGAAVLLLGTLVTSIVVTGLPAFKQTQIALDVNLDPERIDPENLFRARYEAVLRDALGSLFPGIEGRDQRALNAMISGGAQFVLRDMVVANPSWIGQTVRVEIPVSDPFDQLAKGNISRDTPERFRRVSDQQIAWFDALEADGRITQPFNWGLFFNADSRFPELAGLSGAIVGSFFALLVCFLLSFPIGIAAAIYLEEFAPKNRWTALIEVNINNLAAVPSVVFGLLGLAVFLGWFGLPRSAPLVGGMVLALMTLPTMIIVTRAALKAVPPSIREAALGIGASKHEMVLHHVLPLAIPGILTGTIIGLAQALGETAPLLLIGMNAFITSPPGGILDSSTALPTQIFIWADSPERGFVARTSAGIMVLLGFLLLMNAVAIFLRQRFERRW